jgi:hypothetical protein
MLKRIKVIYRKLGREKNHGQAIMGTNIIEIDVRTKGKKLFEILLHEADHLLHPEESEEEVERNAIILTNMLWEQGYRKTDNDNSCPLQDGTL